MAIFSSRQSTHLFEVLVYAGADLLELFHHVLSEIIIVIFGNPLEYR